MVKVSPSSLKHLRPPVPLDFSQPEPMEEYVGQSTRHVNLCHALYDLLRRAVDPNAHTVGADQYVYFNGREPRRCLAPDAFVKVGRPQDDFSSWKTWERGAPELAIEVLSPSNDREPWTIEEKLVRYHELGVRELVVYDMDAAPGARLRAWDRIDEDLVERVVEDEKTPATTIGLWFVVAPVAGYAAGLRLARAADGRELVPTPQEENEELKAKLHERGG